MCCYAAETRADVVSLLSHETHETLGLSVNVPDDLLHIVCNHVIHCCPTCSGGRDPSL